ncbi:MAG: DUF2891 domain-containing protein [Bacteroidia bacterium]|nr:DUF2891 domain-containing protein [Bacteroidia bacterium]
MKNCILLCVILAATLNLTQLTAQQSIGFTDEIALKLSALPLNCIDQEYPNKPGHTYGSADEVGLSPKALHPVFYGCFDWHSSVHGHWMLIRLLKTKPNISNKNEIIAKLNSSFDKSAIEVEKEYFTKYVTGKGFERTYGWAWLLKLDEELVSWDNPMARQWHENLQPLTKQIIELWREYLPKQTYPNRTGVHPNSAFALGFAIDWARECDDKEFEKELIKKSVYFYGDNTETPAHLEPDGADFFSPSLEIADLMRRILSRSDFEKWLNTFYTQKGIERISEIPVVSDLSDYQTVHLVGLSFSRAWCMKGVAKSLSNGHPLKSHFEETAQKLLNNALPLVFDGNYGGEHWLASFALMALE